MHEQHLLPGHLHGAVLLQAARVEVLGRDVHHAAHRGDPRPPIPYLLVVLVSTYLLAVLLSTYLLVVLVVPTTTYHSY